MKKKFKFLLLNFRSSFDQKPDVEDYLDGYEQLVDGNKQIRFLADAKIKCREARLRIDEIPEDSHKFSNFQLDRLLRRNKINTQIEVVSFCFEF